MPLMILHKTKSLVRSVDPLVHCNWDQERGHLYFDILFKNWLIAFSIRTTQDPLVHHGRHFGRAMHAFCNVQTFITNGLAYMADVDEDLATST